MGVLLFDPLNIQTSTQVISLQAYFDHGTNVHILIRFCLKSKTLVLIKMHKWVLSLSLLTENNTEPY